MNHNLTQNEVKFWKGSGCSWVAPLTKDHLINPDIGKFYLLLTVLNSCRKDETKEKEAGNGPFLKRGV